MKWSYSAQFLYYTYKNKKRNIKIKENKACRVCIFLYSVCVCESLCTYYCYMPQPNPSVYFTILFLLPYSPSGALTFGVG